MSSLSRYHQQVPQDGADFTYFKYLRQQSSHRPRPITSLRGVFRGMHDSDVALLKKNRYKMVPHIEMSQLSLDDLSWKARQDLKKVLKNMKGTSRLRWDLQECESWRLRDFTKRLEVWKHVKELTVNFVQFKEKFNPCAKVLFRQIRHFKELKKFELKFIECNFIKDCTLQKLDSEFKRLVNLTHLYMDFNNCQRIDIQKECNFLLKVRFPESLRSLGLNFANFEIKSARWLRHFASKLKKYPMLDALNLNFSGAHHFNDGDIIALSAIFASLRLISKLSLNFITCEDVTPEGLEILSESVKGLRNLSMLHLYFSFYLNYYQSQILSGDFADSLSSLRALTSLKLDFSYSQSLCEEDFKNLAFGLSVMDQLESLKLNFTGCVKMSNGCLKHIAKALKKKRNLTSLEIKFECFIHFIREKLITDEGVQALADSIRGLKSLKVLYLNLEDCNLSYEGVGAISNSISQLQNLTNLKVIYNEKMYWNNRPILNLFHNNKKRLAVMFDNLKNCSSLSKLHLEFPNMELTNQQVSNLAQSLKSLSHLSRLKLKFAPSKQASGKGAVESLFSALKLMSTLSVLSLSFYRDSLCEDDFHCLLSNLKEIKLLSKLKLDIQRSRRFGEKLTNEMSLAFQSLSWLKSLELNYSTCDNLRIGKDLFTLMMRLTGLNCLRNLSINYTCQLKQCEMMNILKELDFKTKFKSLSSFTLNDDIIV
jgi:hypothetical protein